MNNVVFEDELKRRLERAMVREKERLLQARHRRNVAAMVDFASNLLSLAGRGKGVRYMPVTNALAQHGNAYSAALQRYNESLNDYRGEIAGNILRERLAANRLVTSPAQKKLFVGSLPDNTPPLIDKMRIDKVFNNCRTIKSNDYVSAKSR